MKSSLTYSVSYFNLGVLDPPHWRQDCIDLRFIGRFDANSFFKGQHRIKPVPEILEYHCTVPSVIGVHAVIERRFFKKSILEVLETLRA